MDHDKAAPVRRFSISTLALAGMLAGALTLGGCATNRVLVHDFKLENTAIGISRTNPLNVSVLKNGLLEASPTQAETTRCKNGAKAFVKDITAPIQKALSAELRKSHVKVADKASTYRMVRFMRGLYPNMKSDAKSEAFLKVLKAKEEASGNTDQQPDMFLNIFIQNVMATPNRNGGKDRFFLSVQASVVTIKGPGTGKGPVWKTSFYADATFDRENNDAVINEIVSKVIDRLKTAKVIS